MLLNRGLVFLIHWRGDCLLNGFTTPPTVDARNPFRTAPETMGETTVCWYLQGIRNLATIHMNEQEGIPIGKSPESMAHLPFEAGTLGRATESSLAEF